jgi:hypothetical protein
MYDSDTDTETLHANNMDNTDNTGNTVFRDELDDGSESEGGASL